MGLSTLCFGVHMCKTSNEEVGMYIFFNVTIIKHYLTWNDEGDNITILDTRCPGITAFPILRNLHSSQVPSTSPSQVPRSTDAHCMIRGR